MHNRLPSRRRPDRGTGKGAPAPQGNTIPAQGETQAAVPRMPHERDESADDQVRKEPSAQRMGQVAHDDIERGLVDTSRSVELDATYEKIREGDPKQRP
jgi:hypothetical protein